jgi:hypothetical protein
MMVNALNFFVFIALIVMTLLAVIFAYDIRDPVGEGVAETWSGPTGIRVTDLEPNDYCEDSLDADQVARDGVDAVKNTGECNRFYSWARAMSKSNPIERCASLDEPLTSDTRTPDRHIEQSLPIPSRPLPGGPSSLPTQLRRVTGPSPFLF